MADSDVALGAARPSGRNIAGLLPGLLPGGLVIGLLAALIAVSAIGLLLAAPGTDGRRIWTDPYIWSILRFTVVQATLSALISIVLAIPVARALARRPSFAGRSLLIRLLGVPMVLPTIVGVLGMVILLGRNGWLNQAWGWLGLPGRFDFYGLSGILMAHVFFNMPFAARLMLAGWATIPSEQWRLASQLGMSGPQIFRLIEWPMIREVAPGIAGLIFLLCFTSFAVVLTLGGGPPNATLEVAIYQALRFDFDLQRGLALSVLQVAVCACVMAVLMLWARPIAPEATLQAADARPDGRHPLARVIDVGWLLIGAVIVLAPLAALASRFVTGPIVTVITDGDVWAAAGRSLGVGLAAGSLSLISGWGLLSTARWLDVRRQRRKLAGLLETAASLSLVVPPMVLGAGMFLVLRAVADPFSLGLVIVVIVNAVMGLPFVVRILNPPMTQAARRYDRLIQGLGMRPLDRFRLVDWPLLRRPIVLALGLTVALSFGDFGVIALFGTAETETLPMLLYQRLSAYRMDEAAVVAGLLILLCLFVFTVIDKGVGGRASR